MGWQEPKTDWTANDRLNYQDYNRIKNNLVFLWLEASAMYGDFPIADMGADMEGNLEPWKVRYFNAFEENLDKINARIFTQDYGMRQTFYENGPFIRYSELNRIESATLTMNRVIKGAKAVRKRLSFRLGSQKGFKA